MGADLCGYLMVGPARLNRRKIKRAKEMYRVIREHMKERLGAFQKSWYAYWLIALPYLVKQKDTRMHVTFGTAGTRVESLRQLKKTISSMPEELVDQFVDMWERKERHRDFVRREDPHRPKQQIVFVGERTWGDGPESDSAWGVTEAMFTLGLIGVLGVR